ncbi:hypothetical protein KAS42_05765, partial [bacterium]|nr:hypothetical protein [bacterium]
MKTRRNYIYYFFLSSPLANLWRASVLCLLLSITILHADTFSKPTWRSFSETGRFITAIAWDKDNNLWVAGEELGVSMIDEKTIKTFDIPYCYSIVCDDLGRVWIGSLRQGLFCYDKGKWKNFNTLNGLPSNSVYAISLDKDNNLYCAVGLSLAKLSAGKWTILSLPDTLPKSEISCMDFDEDGNLWVGFSLGGTAKFNGTDWELYPLIKKGSIELSD